MYIAVKSYFSSIPVFPSQNCPRVIRVFQGRIPGVLTIRIHASRQADDLRAGQRMSRGHGGGKGGIWEGGSVGDLGRGGGILQKFVLLKLGVEN